MIDDNESDELINLFGLCCEELKLQPKALKVKSDPIVTRSYEGLENSIQTLNSEPMHYVIGWRWLREKAAPPIDLEESILTSIRRSLLVTSEILGKSIRYCSSQYCFRSERGLLSRAPPRV